MTDVYVLRLSDVLCVDRSLEDLAHNSLNGKYLESGDRNELKTAIDKSSAQSVLLYILAHGIPEGFSVPRGFGIGKAQASTDGDGLDRTDVERLSVRDNGSDKNTTFTKGDLKIWLQSLRRPAETSTLIVVDSCYSGSIRDDDLSWQPNFAWVYSCRSHERAWAQKHSRDDKRAVSRFSQVFPTALIQSELFSTLQEKLQASLGRHQHPIVVPAPNEAVKSFLLLRARRQSFIDQLVPDRRTAGS